MKIVHNAIDCGVVVGTITFLVLAIVGCVSAPQYRIEGGTITLDSPFALEIGSTEYAKVFGDVIQTSAYATYNPETNVTTTNIHHHARAMLSAPYFGCTSVNLAFKDEDMALKSCHLSCGDPLPSGKKMSYDECRKTVQEIANDMSRRLGIAMVCVSDKTEDQVMEDVRRFAEERKRECQYGFALSFVHYGGKRLLGTPKVDYDVCGLYGSNGKCSVSITCSMQPEFMSYKPGDKIPVYTNSVRSAASTKLMSAAEQTKTHKEAEKLQETTIGDERKKIELRYGFVAKVLFVNEDVKAGTVLTKDMLCGRDYIAMGVRDRCLHVDDLKSVVGRKLAFDLKRGSILLKTDLCKKDGRAK